MGPQKNIFAGSPMGMSNSEVAYYSGLATPRKNNSDWWKYKGNDALGDSLEAAAGAMALVQQAQGYADTNDIQGYLNNYLQQANVPINDESSYSIMKQASMRPQFYRPTDEEIGKMDGGKATSAILGSGISGASAGSVLGPIAAVVGGAVGLIAGGIGVAANQKNAEKKRNQLDNAYQGANLLWNSRLNSAINNFNQQSYYDMMGYNAKCGGKLHKFDFGGDLNNNVNIIGNGSKHEANPYGGVQQGVDNQGVPNLVEEGEVVFKLGSDEYVLSNDPSLRVKYKEKKQPSNADLFLKKYDGMTFAEAGKKAQRESEERPNDRISKDTKDFMMSTLYNEQERIKQQRAENKFKRQLNKLPEEQQMALMDSITQQNQEQEANELAMQEEQAMQDPMYQQMLQQQMMQQGMMKFGGKMGNKFLWGGHPLYEDIYNPYASDTTAKTPAKDTDLYTDPTWSHLDFANPDTMYVKDANGEIFLNMFMPGSKTGYLNYNKDYLDFVRSKELRDWLTSDPEGQEWFKSHWLTPEYTKANYYNYWLQNKDNKNLTIDDLIAGMQDSKISDMHKAGLELWNLFSNRRPEWTKSIQAINTETPEPKTNPVTNPTEGDKKDLDLSFPIFQPKKTWLRYAPVALSGAAMLTDALGLTNKPDYSMFDGLIQSSSNGANGFMPVRFKPIGDYMRYRPYDVNYERNRIDANTQATNRLLTDLSNASAANKEAAIIANTYAGQLAQGEAYKRAFDTNWERYRAMKEFNRGTNQFNSQYGLQADMANAGNFANAVNRQSQNNVAAMQLKWDAKKLADQGRAANINNFVTSLQGIGTENLNYNKALFDLMTGNPIRKEFYPTIYAMMGQYKKGKQLAKLMQESPDKDISELLEELNA